MNLDNVQPGSYIYITAKHIEKLYDSTSNKYIKRTIDAHFVCFVTKLEINKSSRAISEVIFISI